MKKIIRLLATGICLLAAFVQPVYAQKTYAEMLGYPAGAKVVVLHVDDVGMSYESNAGAIDAMEKGVANSCSMMMTCPWIPGFFNYLKTHPNTDAGLHLTLTSEWKDYRWHGLSGAAATPGLTDVEGALWASVDSVVKNASAAEVEQEIEAQIQRAKKMGWQPTHLDSHMGTLFARPDFTEKYLAAGIRHKIPVMFPGGHATLIRAQGRYNNAMVQQFKATGAMLWAAGLPVLDDLFSDTYSWTPPDSIAGSDEKLQAYKTKKYMQLMDSLQPGITMVIMHCTGADAHFAHISDSGPLRRSDLLAMLDPALRSYIARKGIVLTTWREMMARRAKIK